MLRMLCLPGESDIDQLKTIFRALGAPTEDERSVRRSTPHIHHSTPLTSCCIRFQKGHTNPPDYVPVVQFQKAPLRDFSPSLTIVALNFTSCHCSETTPQGKKKIKLNQVLLNGNNTCTGSTPSLGLQPTW